jgi:hypothetical protein
MRHGAQRGTPSYANLALLPSGESFVVDEMHSQAMVSLKIGIVFSTTRYNIQQQQQQHVCSSLLIVYVTVLAARRVQRLYPRSSFESAIP